METQQNHLPREDAEASILIDQEKLDRIDNEVTDRLVIGKFVGLKESLVIDPLRQAPFSR